MKRLIFKSFLILPLFLILLLSGCEGYVVFNPKGPAAAAQKDLIIWSIFLMLFIVLVVFVVFTVFIILYREKPGKSKYDPEQKGHKGLEFIWTLVPVLIIVALAVPTVKTIYALEGPPEVSEHKEPLVVHVTTADWKFIFSYPKQNIETVNYLNIPVNRPIKFKLTSADTMASLWIPQLGGEKYAMAGMLTEIMLQANETGTYKGRNANYTGGQFAKMTFKVHVKTQENFHQWVNHVQRTAPKLTENHYIKIIQPSVVQKMTFSSTHLQYVHHSKNADYVLEHNRTRDLDNSESIFQ